jgi:predicted nucleotidyltransferase
MSNLDNIKTILTAIKPTLEEKFYVDSIGLFGSVVRKDFSPLSDIDILIDFTRPIGIDFIELADFLETTLQRPVDLVSRKGIKPKYFAEIESEIIYV